MLSEVYLENNWKTNRHHIEDAAPLEDWSFAHLGGFQHQLSIIWIYRSSRSMVPVPGITDSNLNSDEKINHTRYKDRYHVIQRRMRSEACIVHHGMRLYMSIYFGSSLCKFLL
ncbi:unnamed protein product [Musa acuminata subsp. malaccensis]|uniref:(wild Malaysian banana) hypothetical protein n=1 Tax=Musa acuminata subsp. malaccensis TaxID=214687 RepID=A0A804JFR7_MUSAM|nr:unnamed protein product [Musa acuminata subsp. malaccensis]